MKVFRDRVEAGMRLADRLMSYEGRQDAVVLALPRGGVVVGFTVARALGLSLDVFIVRKIGFPGQPELAIGALSETGVRVLNDEMLRRYGIPVSYLEAEIPRREAEIARRIDLYRNGKALPRLEGKIVILVDDGVATGSTLKAAVATLHRERLSRLVVGIPVAPRNTRAELEGMVDELVCLFSPPDFSAVGAYYNDFSQTSDDEVVGLLAKTAA
jgi:predicted phosphoribosyltransferase